MKALLLLANLYFTNPPLFQALVSLARGVLAATSWDSVYGQHIGKNEGITLTDKFHAVFEAANNKERSKETRR